ncbi:MAG: macro domain-containing protein [Thermoguttaceae bacterium]|jgi:O-acetyl-ADP-ribose deacetylase (regulator of RNase III)|nr:macro domain-containing protein [Thermoguttaceae bacterium]
MPTFDVVIADITKFTADAIVNAANKTLLGGGGVDGAIHRAAGPQLLAYCIKLKGCETGSAKISPAFGISTARYIIHTPGPRFSRRKADLCDALLSSSYFSSLYLAEKADCQTIAFPSISTGGYSFPLERAAMVVAKTFFVYKKLGSSLTSVTMACFDVATANAYKEAFESLKL